MWHGEQCGCAAQNPGPPRSTDMGAAESQCPNIGASLKTSLLIWANDPLQSTHLIASTGAEITNPGTAAGRPLLSNKQTAERYAASNTRAASIPWLPWHALLDAPRKLSSFGSRRDGRLIGPLKLRSGISVPMAQPVSPSGPCPKAAQERPRFELSANQPVPLMTVQHSG